MVAIFHCSERLVKQNNERATRYALWMPNTREILCANMVRLLGESDDLASRARLSKRSKVALGTISALASGKKQGSWPTIKTVEKIAAAYRIQAWELLHPNLGASASEAAWQKKMIALRAVMDNDAPAYGDTPEDQ